MSWISGTLPRWFSIPKNSVDLSVVLEDPRTYDKVYEACFNHRPNKKCFSCFFGFGVFYYSLSHTYSYMYGHCCSVDFFLQISVEEVYNMIKELHIKCNKEHADELQNRACLECTEEIELKLLDLFRRHNIMGRPYIPPIQLLRDISCFVSYLWGLWCECENDCFTFEEISIYTHRFAHLLDREDSRQ